MAAAAYSCPPASSFRRPGSRWPSMTDDVQVQRFNADGSIASASPAFDYSGAVGLARVNPDGTLDAGFGNGGVLTTTFNGNEAVEAVVIQPDGKILAVGFSDNNTTGQSFIA